MDNEIHTIIYFIHYLPSILSVYLHATHIGNSGNRTWVCKNVHISIIICNQKK